jgi:hypothetical protein
MLDFTGKAKWYVMTLNFCASKHIRKFRDAWKKVEGTSQEDAMVKYYEKLLEVSHCCLGV